MTAELDHMDKKILALIQADASLTSADIAERVGLSQSPCWRRIKHLEEEGYISRRVTLLDRKRLGFNFMVFVHVNLQAHDHQTLPQFEEAIRRCPEVVEVYTLLGAKDYLLRIVVPNLDVYEKFYREKLSQMPGVRETSSTIVLSEIKSTTELPLNLLPTKG